MELLLQYPLHHPEFYNVAFVVLGLILGRYKLVLIPLKFLLDKMIKQEEDKLAAQCGGKGEVV